MVVRSWTARTLVRSDGAQTRSVCACTTRQSWLSSRGNCSATKMTRPYLCDAEAWSRGARHFAVVSSVAPLSLGALRAKCKDAFRGDSGARAELRALGRSVLASGGVDALCTLQGELREAEITAHGSAHVVTASAPPPSLGMLGKAFLSGHVSDVSAETPSRERAGCGFGAAGYQAPSVVFDS